MIYIQKSPNADSRTAKEDIKIDELKYDTRRHISDVSRGLEMIADLIKERGYNHDHTKLENLEEFHAALTSGQVKESEWYKKHITEERHHLKSYVHNDVNIIDVIEHIVDCTMAGLARSGEVYDIDIQPEVLQLAINNTVEFIKNNTTVIDDIDDIFQTEIDD